MLPVKNIISQNPPAGTWLQLNIYNLLTFNNFSFIITNIIGLTVIYSLLKICFWRLEWTLAIRTMIIGKMTNIILYNYSITKLHTYNRKTTHKHMNKKVMQQLISLRKVTQTNIFFSQFPMLILIHKYMAERRKRGPLQIRK